jgi:hypothetical protein
VTARGGGDAVHGGQAQPGAGALRLGGEERFEGAFRDLGPHPLTGVADPHARVPAGGTSVQSATSSSSRCVLPVSIDSVPPVGIASRALTARLTRICSIWLGSTRTGALPLTDVARDAGHAEHPPAGVGDR